MVFNVTKVRRLQSISIKPVKVHLNQLAAAILVLVAVRNKVGCRGLDQEAPTKPTYVLHVALQVQYLDFTVGGIAGKVKR